MCKLNIVYCIKHGSVSHQDDQSLCTLFCRINEITAKSKRLAVLNSTGGRAVKTNYKKAVACRNFGKSLKNGDQETKID